MPKGFIAPNFLDSGKLTICITKVKVVKFVSIYCRKDVEANLTSFTNVVKTVKFASPYFK